jgi:hypothetical protein
VSVELETVAQSVGVLPGNTLLRLGLTLAPFRRPESTLARQGTILLRSSFFAHIRIGPHEICRRARRASESKARGLGLAIDFPPLGSNNPPMARPDAVRRVKSYSAANGYVYQYCFYEVNRIWYESNAAGQFIYAISADRKTTFPLSVVVLQPALQQWAQTNGRSLSSSEEYAIAKMRLFQAFDEGEVPVTAEAAKQVCLLVDQSNLESLLTQLHI